MGVSGSAAIRLGRTSVRALGRPGTDQGRLQRAFGAAALLGLAPLAHAVDRPLLAFGCVGAALPLLAAAAFNDRRIRVAVEALVIAGTLAACAVTNAVTARWPSRMALATVTLLVTAALAVEAARRAALARRFAPIPFWLLAALLAAAGNLHTIAHAWRGLLAGPTIGTDALGLLSLTAAHAGYALSGVALVFALLVRSFFAGAPADASLVAATDRWRLIAASGAALAAVLHTAS